MVQQVKTILCLCIFILLATIVSGTFKTRQLTVLFRHGDRAPSRLSESFPNDPHINETYLPGGHGALTNRGKLRAYELGELIRKNYSDFLGDIYSPSEVFARSTDVERTIMTLQLVMAGVFPPSQAQKWHPKLNWQPVVANFRVGKHNFLDLSKSCPSYNEEVQRVRNSPEILEKINSYKYYFDYVSQLTGKEIDAPRKMTHIYNALTAQLTLGLELPDWAHEIYENGTLLSAGLLDFEVHNYNAKLQKLNGGRVLKRILDSTAEILEGVNDVKLNLFSGHDSNIIALLYTLGVYQAHLPAYASALFVELLEGESDHFVKVQYYRGIPPVTEELTIPGCTSPCPLETFKTLLGDVTPTDDEVNCKES